MKESRLKRAMQAEEERRDPVIAEREREKKRRTKSQSLRRNPALGPGRQSSLTGVKFHESSKDLVGNRFTEV